MAHKYRGVFTALVTPFNQDGSLDLGALDALVDQQLAGGINGLVPCGTTGEAATMTDDERAQVIGRVVKRVAGRVPVVAGTGTNDTRTSIENQKRAKDLGVDAALVVTPYYNKPTPEGLYRHYAAITKAVELPVILYNVPGRTGCDMKAETVVRVAGLPNVIGVKEATADLDRVTVIRRGTSKSFAILSGDDGTTAAFCALGGDGCISVASNVAPKLMVDMVTFALANEAHRAREIHDKLRDVFSTLFIESNPIPVKAGVALLGIAKESYRLPLCEMAPENKQKLVAAMTVAGLLA